MMRYRSFGLGPFVCLVASMLLVVGGLHWKRAHSISAVVIKPDSNLDVVAVSPKYTVYGSRGSRHIDPPGIEWHGGKPCVSQWFENFYPEDTVLSVEGEFQQVASSIYLLEPCVVKKADVRNVDISDVAVSSFNAITMDRILDVPVGAIIPVGAIAPNGDFTLLRVTAQGTLLVKLMCADPDTAGAFQRWIPCENASGRKFKGTLSTGAEFYMEAIPAVSVVDGGPAEAVIVDTEPLLKP